MDTIKDRIVMDLREAEDIKKRWQEYTEKLYKKDLHDEIKAQSPCSPAGSAGSHPAGGAA